MLDSIIRGIGMASMLFNICTQSPETVKICMTDQHVWLWPTVLELVGKPLRGPV